MDQNKIIVEKLLKGDTKSFKNFFEEFYPSVCLFADKYINDKNVAEDIAQDAFIKFWKRKEQFNDIRSIKAFIYTVVKNDCLNHIKLKGIRDNILQNELLNQDTFYEFVLEEETYRIIHQAINDLPSQSQKIILLSMKGYKNHEIAEKLDISINTVKTLKKNAYATLRSKLKDHLFILFLLNYILN